MDERRETKAKKNRILMSNVKFFSEKIMQKKNNKTSFTIPANR